MYMCACKKSIIPNRMYTVHVDKGSLSSVHDVHVAVPCSWFVGVEPFFIPCYTELSPGALQG